MSTRRQRSQQHSKGKKRRPGHWHQGRGLARQQAALKKLAAAEDRGRTAEDELRAVAARYEDVDVWQNTQRAAPFVPVIEAAL